MSAESASQNFMGELRPIAKKAWTKLLIYSRHALLHMRAASQGYNISVSKIKLQNIHTKLGIWLGCRNLGQRSVIKIIRLISQYFDARVLELVAFYEICEIGPPGLVERCMAELRKLVKQFNVSEMYLCIFCFDNLKLP